ncbi:hypothetical protein Pan153_38250 [Gimesia panareensis]|uniref:Uncharacterized protein n=1 Tax=Gimesia panareensis TaxID=2527978 RepID=A0A518FS39_9PLAN|nr:hypothetical protein [Gimesia panareensis]QDV19162.1 hypothetical protein Pan153_38250 [Gimesia panareensis]
MAEKYYIECDCGKRARVELYEAGMDKRCQACQQMVRVPDTITLQQSSGDNYPLLRPLEKILTTLREGEPPFDGLCHHCECRDADILIPVKLRILIERYMKNDGGIRPTITGGVKLVASAAEEYWKEVWFPLLLCSECQKEYIEDREQRRRKRRWELLGLFGLLGAFLVLAYFFTAIVALCSLFFWLLLAFCWASQFRNRIKLQAWQLPWLEEIRWVSEALAMEDEYNLETGKTLDLRKIRHIIEGSENSEDNLSPIQWWMQQFKRSYFEIP